MMALGFDYNGRGFNLSCVNTSLIIFCRVSLSSRHTCRFILFHECIEFIEGDIPIFTQWRSQRVAKGPYMLMQPPFPEKKLGERPITGCLINIVTIKVRVKVSGCL